MKKASSNTIMFELNYVIKKICYQTGLSGLKQGREWDFLLFPLQNFEPITILKK